MKISRTIRAHQRVPAGQLTDRQQEMLDYLQKHHDKHGYVPTIREIGNALGISSPNGVTCHLTALEKKGFISRERHLSRTIRFLSPAGASARAEGGMVRISVPPRLLSPREALALATSIEALVKAAKMELEACDGSAT